MQNSVRRPPIKRPTQSFLTFSDSRTDRASQDSVRKSTRIPRVVEDSA